LRHWLHAPKKGAQVGGALLCLYLLSLVTYIIMPRARGRNLFSGLRRRYILRGSQRVEARAALGSTAVHRGFIDALYGASVGWVQPPSGCFSFPESLVGFPWTRPSSLPLFARVRRGRIVRTSALQLSKKFGTRPSPTDVRKSRGSERLSQHAVCHCSFQVGF
jgi:hypothetical protein